MGKERQDSHMFKKCKAFAKPTQRSQQHSPSDRQELIKEWASTQSITLKEHLFEDGQAKIMIKSSCLDFTITCKGIKNEGNKFTDLAILLREKSLILDNEKIVAFYLFKGYTWSQANSKTERFRSGDNILITIKEKNKVKVPYALKTHLLVRKAIRKPVLTN